MSSRRQNGSGVKFPCADAIESSKGKNVPRVSDCFADQLADEVAAMSLDTEQDGGREGVVMKPKNRSAGNAGRQNHSKKILSNAWTESEGSTNAWPGTKGPAIGWSGTRVPAIAWTGKGSASAWTGKGSASAWTGKGSTSALAAPAGDYRKPVERGNFRSQSSYKGNENKCNQPTGYVNWWQRSGHISRGAEEDIVSASLPTGASDNKGQEKDDDKDNDEQVFITDDMYDSDDIDDSQMSHETGKNNPLLQDFFEILDKMSINEINKKNREWHCPACSNGKGAIHWYKGLQPLINHAKTKGKTRARVHREFAQLLEEELLCKGASVSRVIPSGETFGMWRGLNENVVRDTEIVWPPMVIIMNTKHDREDNGNWLGMGNAELLEYFGAYEAVKSKHSYGPDGHRGISVLIFETSAMGFMEAECLSRHFEHQGTDRDAWDHRRVLFLPDGQRQLYGFMAKKRDLEFFNKHHHGSSKLKFEMRSYQEMVVRKLKQMNEKLGKTLAENRILKQRTKLLREQNKEIDCQEEFFQKQIQIILDARNVEEENFKKVQQLHREKMKSYMETPSTEDCESRIEKGTTWILYQSKEMDEFGDERDKLLKDLEERKAELKRQHYEEDVKLEEEYNAELVQLIEKYKPPR